MLVLHLAVFLDPEHLRYTQNGILHMLDRNKRIKSRPERFQSCKDQFDLVITCEERVYDQVLEGERGPGTEGGVGGFSCEVVKYQLGIVNTHKMKLQFRARSLWIHVDQRSLFSHSDLSSREQETFTPVHVINVDIQDNHEEATLGAFLICELCQCVSVSACLATSNHYHRITLLHCHSMNIRDIW